MTAILEGSAEPDTGRDYVFVVGSPRSGTTWLRMLLGEHPLVAVDAAETHILHERYLGHLGATWERELREKAEGRSAFSLPELLAPEEFLLLCREFAAHVLRKIARKKPGARLVVDKSPGHVHHAKFLLEVFPEARVLHIARDPRDVYCSVRAASRSWGKQWAASSAAAGARAWVGDAEAGLEFPRLTGRYRQVRYETLHEDGAGELGRIFDWLQVPADAALCAAALKANDFERLRDHSKDTSFFRRGKAGGWREELSRRDIRVIEYIAGEHMRRLGYELVFAPRRKPIRLALRDGLQRWGRAVVRRGRGLVQDL